MGFMCEKSKAGVGGLKRSNEALANSSDSSGVASAQQARRTRQSQRRRNGGGGPPPVASAPAPAGPTSAEPSASTSQRTTKRTTRRQTGSSEEPIVTGSVPRSDRGTGSSPVELQFDEFDDNPEAMWKLLSENGHVFHRDALPHEIRLACVVMGQLEAGNLQAYRSLGTGSDTDPSTNRWSLNILGYIATPVGYLRDATETGRAFVKGLVERMSAAKNYLLGWDHSQGNIPELLIGPHADQTKGDVDAQGRPSLFINREVLSFLMAYYLCFDMVLVRYINDGNGGWKKTERKIAGCCIKVSKAFYSYCMDPVGSGRHSGYWMIDENGIRWDIIFRHHTKRTEDASILRRGIFNSDFHHSSAEESAAGMEDYRAGTQQSTTVKDWLMADEDLARFDDRAVATAHIDAAMARMEVYEWGDRCKCRSCRNKATCVDTSGFGDDEADPPKNRRGVEIVCGTVAASYWNGLDATEDDGVREVGTITSVAKDGDSITVGVVFAQGNTRYYWETSDLELLHPPSAAEKVQLLGERHDDATGSGTDLRHVSCDDCVRADDGVLINSGKVIEDPCPRCMRQETLQGCNSCAECCGNPNCRGLPQKDGTRKFFCGGGGEEVEEGAPLTVENMASSSTGYICKACYNKGCESRRKSKRKEASPMGTEAEMWMAFWRALEEHPELYCYQSGKVNYKALLGLVDGVPAIASLVDGFGSDNRRLSCHVRNNFTVTALKEIKACPDCLSCKESESGACEYVGTKITNLALYEQYLLHSNGGNWKRGAPRGNSNAKTSKSRFADLLD